AWTSQPDHRVLHSFPTRRSSDLAVIFHEPEPADIVRGAVAAGDRDATIRIRLGLPSDQRIEAHGTTVIEFAEHTDATGEFVTQRSEEHTSELQSRFDLVCRLLLE